MKRFTRVGGVAAAMPAANIDTDVIMPKQFLRGIDREGLARGLFHDLRFDAVGAPRPDFVLNRPGTADARFLVVGPNFGCGSSREHAPWALTDFGFRAVISTGIADIFRSNALKNGLVPVVVAADVHADLLEQPGREVTLDLQAQALRFGNHMARFEIDPFSRACLLEGVDPLGYVLNRLPAVEAFEAAAA